MRTVAGWPGFDLAELGRRSVGDGMHDAEVGGDLKKIGHRRMNIIAGLAAAADDDSGDGRKYVPRSDALLCGVHDPRTCFRAACERHRDRAASFRLRSSATVGHGIQILRFGFERLEFLLRLSNVRRGVAPSASSIF